MEIVLWDVYYAQYYAKDLSDYKKEFLNKVSNIEVKNDDVWVITLPKCGTTWMQELVWLILHNFDFETAKREFIEERAPLLESNFYFNDDLSRALEPIEKLKSPRLIKTHLPLSLLPKQLLNGKAKIVYVFRNPADALVSMYYHLRKAGLKTDITLDNAIKNYIENGVYTNVIFDFIAEVYKLRNEPWLYFTSFECMKSDLSKIIQDISEFLNKSINEIQMQQMLKHLSFEEMQLNPKVHLELTFNWLHQKLNLPFEKHNFVRKGKVNSYKEELSPEIATKIEKWTEENLAKRDLKLGELLLPNI